jgi:hypothetical protein
LTRRRQYAVSAILVSAIRFFSDLKMFQRFKNSFSDSLKLSNSFSDSHFSQFSQEKIISRKVFPAKITRTDVFLVIYRNSRPGWIRQT